MTNVSKPEFESDGLDRPQRLDQALTARGLCATRAQARAAIEAGGVSVNGRIATKPAMRIHADAALEVTLAHPWASRGGVKLDHALSAFGLEVEGRVCLDVGASTGGFTDVLLTRKARHVFAVDVGRGQLISRLREDARVTSIESTDARRLTRDLITDAPNLIVCDASFIGLEKLIGPALDLATEAADLVALFKPQFQVGPDHVGKGGLVTDDDVVNAAAARFEDWLSDKGWRIAGWTPSPTLGGDGNKERLCHARR
ncbi:MAG: TlyA family RNA methyltransferase [Pseudomonadota bacterium]